MKSIIKIWIYSNLHIALIAFLLSLESNYLLGIASDLTSPLFVFFSTIFIYNLGYYSVILFNDDAQRYHAEWMTKHIKYWVFSMLIAVLGIIYLFSNYSFESQIVILALSVLSILYIIHDIRFFGIKFSIRDIPYFKTFIVSAIWVMITVLPQVIEYDLFKENTLWISLMLERFFFIFSITLMFDIRDIESDPDNFSTIPKSIGIKNTKVIAIISLIIGFYFYQLIPIFTSTSVSMSLLYIAMFASVLYSNKNRDELYYSAWFDGLIGIHALIVIYQLIG